MYLYPCKKVGTYMISSRRPPLSRCFPSDESAAERPKERHREQRDPRLTHDLPDKELEGAKGQGEEDNRVEDGTHEVRRYHRPEPEPLSQRGVYTEVRELGEQESHPARQSELRGDQGGERRPEEYGDDHRSPAELLLRQVPESEGQTREVHACGGHQPEAHEH